MKSQRSSQILSQQEKKMVPKDHRMKKAQQAKKKVKKDHKAKLLKKLPQLYQSFQEKKIAPSRLTIIQFSRWSLQKKKLCSRQKKRYMKKKKNYSSIKGFNRSSSLLFSCWLVISARVEKKDSLMKERKLFKRKNAERLACWKEEGFSKERIQKDLLTKYGLMKESFFERNNVRRSV